MNPITFDAFTKLLGKRLGFDPVILTPETNLVIDLGLESLKLLEMLLEFERLGIQVSIAEAWAIQTVGEAYAYYLKHFQGVAGGRVED